MLRSIRLWLSVTALLCIVPVTAHLAPSPRQLNYQGRLTDATGNPLVGSYQVIFTIYDAPASGTAKWYEKDEVTTESGGLFAVLLGSVDPVPPEIFDGTALYLGIQVGDAPELAPRTQLATVPMAFYSTSAQTAQSATSAPGYLPLAGGTMTGPTTHNSATSRWQTGGGDRIVADPVIRAIQVIGTNGVERARLSDENGGQLVLSDSTLSTYGGAGLFAVGFGGGKGGTFILNDSTGAANVYIDAGSKGNGSVNLPDSAIDSREILDEPGIAANWISGGVGLICGVVSDLLSVTITIPASG